MGWDSNSRQHPIFDGDGACSEASRTRSGTSSDSNLPGTIDVEEDEEDEEEEVPELLASDLECTVAQEMKDSLTPLLGTDFQSIVVSVCTQSPSSAKLLRGMSSELKRVPPLKRLGNVLTYQRDSAIGEFTVGQLQASLGRSLKVCRIKVPSTNEGELGPNGLNLRQTYGMHAVAVERADGVVYFDITPDTAVAEGDYLWAGLRSEGSVGSAGSLCRFVGSSDLRGSVEVGEMPLFQFKAIQSWHGKSLRDIDLRNTAGVTVCAVEREGTYAIFPPPEAVIEDGSSDFLAVACMKKFTQVFRVGQEDSPVRRSVLIVPPSPSCASSGPASPLNPWSRISRMV